jgi:hypothetical protein
MFHHGLLQRMLRRPAADGRGWKDPNVDQATSWSRSRGLGSLFFLVYDLSFYAPLSFLRFSQI